MLVLFMVSGWSFINAVSEKIVTYFPTETGTIVRKLFGTGVGGLFC